MRGRAIGKGEPFGNGGIKFSKTAKLIGIRQLEIARDVLEKLAEGSAARELNSETMVEEEIKLLLRQREIALDKMISGGSEEFFSRRGIGEINKKCEGYRR